MHAYKGENCGYYNSFPTLQNLKSCIALAITVAIAVLGIRGSSTASEPAVRLAESAGTYTPRIAGVLGTASSVFEASRPKVIRTFFTSQFPFLLVPRQLPSAFEQEASCVQAGAGRRLAGAAAVVLGGAVTAVVVAKTVKKSKIIERNESREEEGNKRAEEPETDATDGNVGEGRREPPAVADPASSSLNATLETFTQMMATMTQMLKNIQAPASGSGGGPIGGSSGGPTPFFGGDNSLLPLLSCTWAISSGSESFDGASSPESTIIASKNSPSGTLASGSWAAVWMGGLVTTAELATQRSSFSSAFLMAFLQMRRPQHHSFQAWITLSAEWW
ncbi:hypothetical protein M5K25_012031 [Dendrobium thyrsiflorum]|uniref:Uncharacterized protein n=1 Tax=Dendrobium thyrsiflorum TaxID=117978 RepID=A0ABD0V4P0_DENTH